MSSTPAAASSSDPSIEATVTRLAVSTLGKQLGEVSPEQALLSGRAGFDSFALMEFVIRLEEQFGLQIADEDLDPDIFYSVSSIAAYIRSRLGQPD
jgi:acyl carrier protein